MKLLGKIAIGFLLILIIFVSICWVLVNESLPQEKPFQCPSASQWGKLDNFTVNSNGLLITSNEPLKAVNTSG